MNRKDFEKAITVKLHENNSRKPIFLKKEVFHISDDYGNSRDFTVKQTEKTVGYTQEDVAAFMEAFIETVNDALKNGEHISIHDFGRFELRYHKRKRAAHPTTGEIFETDPYLTPKFTFGKSLKRCAKIYELNHPEVMLEGVTSQMEETEYEDEGGI